MQLRHLEVFHAIMQVGSVTGAARMLDTSQSSVSKVLQHFELQLGLPLFERKARKLYPTPEARRLYQETGDLVTHLQGVRRLAATLTQHPGDVLRVAATPSIAGAVLAPAVIAWRQRYPYVRCELSTYHTREIVARLLLGEADIGVSLQDPRHAGIGSAVLAEHVVMVAAPAGTWSHAECATPLPVASLAGELIGLADSDPVGALVRAALDAQDLDPACSTVVQTHQLAVALVAAGHGMALVDPFTAASMDPAVVQTRQCAPAMPVSMFLLSREHAVLSDAARALAQHIAKAACATF
ncbi:MAG: LysR family transcriptional regulator [Pseudomonadota bacterium]